MESAIQQANFLSVAAGVRRRDDLAVVDITGDDRLDWLNGQVTNDVRAATGTEGVYALAVTVRGKIMADLWVLHRGERLSVVLPRSAQAAVLASFDSQIIMEDVALEPATQEHVISVQGPRAAEVIEGDPLEHHRCDELGVGGYLVLVPDPAALDAALSRLVASAQRVSGGAVGDAGFELARLRAARGRFGVDFSEPHYPQEAGLIGRAVSFKKGCYLGQEVICTLENRGRTSRQLVLAAGALDAALEPGANLADAEGHLIGQVTSVCRDEERGATLALGYVKAAFANPGARLLAGTTALDVRARVGED